ncbi:MAG: hypothetical protein K5894_11140 [Lachnospiraceae bacterium]|nr:hypothetical protein [Lachnospiraceae bacterium]
MTWNYKLQQQVNTSNIQAVEDAQAAQKAAERRAAQDISDYKKYADKKISDAISSKNAALKQAKETVRAAKELAKLGWGLFAVTVLCCVTYFVFI